MLNSVSLVGNVTRDPELKATLNGTTVMDLSIAVNERRKNGDGQWEDSPNFFDCSMFGVRAEKVSGFIKKGTKVAIQGHLKQSRWEKDGQKRSKVSIIIDELEFMSPKAETVQAEVMPYSDSDVPF